MMWVGIFGFSGVGRYQIPAWGVGFSGFFAAEPKIALFSRAK
jgi:hypothetical protein